MGNITRYGIIEKNDKWIALDLPVTYPVKIVAYTKQISGNDGWTGQKKEITINSGDSNIQIDGTNFSIQHYNNNNGTASFQVKSTRNANNVAYVNWTFNDKELYNYYYDGHRYDKGTGDWDVVSQSTKTLPLIPFGNYSEFRKYILSINGNKTDWLDKSHYPANFSLSVNGKQYTIPSGGTSEKASNAIYVDPTDGNLCMILVKDVQANKDIMIGCAQSGKQNYNYFAKADGQLYISSDNNINGVGKVITKLIAISEGNKFLTFDESFRSLVKKESSRTAERTVAKDLSLMISDDGDASVGRTSIYSAQWGDYANLETFTFGGIQYKNVFVRKRVGYNQRLIAGENNIPEDWMNQSNAPIHNISKLKWNNIDNVHFRTIPFIAGKTTNECWPFAENKLIRYGYVDIAIRKNGDNYELKWDKNGAGSNASFTSGVGVAEASWTTIPVNQPAKVIYEFDSNKVQFLVKILNDNLWFGINLNESSLENPIEYTRGFYTGEVAINYNALKIDSNILQEVAPKTHGGNDAWDNTEIQSIDDAGNISSSWGNPNMVIVGNHNPSTLQNQAYKPFWKGNYRTFKEVSKQKWQGTPGFYNFHAWIGINLIPDYISQVKLTFVMAEHTTVDAGQGGFNDSNGKIVEAYIKRDKTDGKFKLVDKDGTFKKWGEDLACDTFFNKSTMVLNLNINEYGNMDIKMLKLQNTDRYYSCIGLYKIEYARYKVL